MPKSNPEDLARNALLLRQKLEIDSSSRDLADQVGEARPKSKTISRARIEKFRLQMLEMMQSRNWSEAQPCHMVVLWAWCHKELYGVEPEEDLAPTAFFRACGKVHQALERSFHNDPTLMVEFLRWSWSREQYRRKKNPNATRMGLGLQFSSTVIGDWRVATAGRPQASV